MEFADLLFSLSRLVFGAAAAFFAILSWSRTRDIPWVLVIIGTLALYVEIVYTTLERFGVVGGELWTVSGLPLFKMVLVNLPLVFFIAAFIVMIVRKRGL